MVVIKHKCIMYISRTKRARCVILTFSDIGDKET